MIPLVPFTADPVPEPTGNVWNWDFAIEIFPVIEHQQLDHQRGHPDEVRRPAQHEGEGAGKHAQQDGDDQPQQGRDHRAHDGDQEGDL